MKRYEFLSNNNVYLLMLLPALLVMIVIIGYPLLRSLILSFYQYNLAGYYPTKFIGLMNYINIFHEGRFLNACRVTFIFTFCVVLCELIIGISLALLVFREKLWAKILRTLLLIPMVFTPVVAGLLWRFMYHSRGIINYLLISCGLVDKPIIFLGYPHSALISVMIVDIWRSSPFVMIVILAGLATLPIEPIEAAKIDGATSFQMFRYVTLPLLKPIVLIVLLIRGMDAFRILDIIFSMTKGGPVYGTESLSVYAYLAALSYFDIGKACAITFVITILISIMSIILIKALREQQGF